MSLEQASFKRFSKRFRKEHCPHWTTTILWAVGIIIMLSLTIRDLCPIFRDYLDDNKNVHVRVSVEKDPTVASPDLYMCLPLSNGFNIHNLIEDLNNSLIDPRESCYDCEGFTEQSWDIWKGMNLTFDSLEETTRIFIDAFLQKLTSDPRNYDVITRRGPRNLILFQPLIDSIAMYFHEIFDLDVRMLKENGRKKAALLESYHPPYKILSKENVDIMLEIFVKLICVSIDGQFFGSNGSHPWNVSECVKHLLESAVFYPQQEYYETFYQICFILPSSQAEYWIRTNENFHFYGGLGSDLKYYFYQENPLFTEIAEFYGAAGSTTKEIPKIGYSMKMKILEKDKERKHCHEYRSNIDCMTDCKTRKIVHECHCVPFSTRNYPAGKKAGGDLPYCNISHYRPCKIIPGLFEDADCKKICDTACEFIVYQYQISSILVGMDQGQTFAVRVEPMASQYMLFSVGVKDSRESLISQIGGSFNFYLGISGLSCFFILILGLELRRQWNAHKSQEHIGKAKGDLMLWLWRMVATGNMNANDQASLDQLEQEYEDAKAQMEDLSRYVAKKAKKEGTKKTVETTKV